MKTKILITGGAGFIGSNLADHFSKKGYRVTIYDSLKRNGSKINLDWLKKNHPQLSIVNDDIRNFKSVSSESQKSDIIFHLAGQVAVTSSILNPREDFEVNALGTFNVLEGARKSIYKPMIIYASTNKVYGGLEDLKIIEKDTRYEFKDYPYGIDEARPLDFHSPYGCSKGTGDQYVRDYARIYDIPTVVFRQSCVYGPRQFGIEDQGWVAWFIIAHFLGKPITIYGDGKQVRDILYIDDLIDLFDIAINNTKRIKGKIYNVGGGIRNTLSIWKEFSPILERLFRKKILVSHAAERPGDQKIYISDIRTIEKDLGWTPKTGISVGINNLFNWVQENKSLFAGII